MKESNTEITAILSLIQRVIGDQFSLLKLFNVFKTLRTKHKPWSYSLGCNSWERPMAEMAQNCYLSNLVP